MGRSDLERLSKEELIALVLRFQRPEKTSRTSSKPPSTDRKEQRERSKPGGAKPGHEGHSRIISDTTDEVVEHRPGRCSCCAAVLMADLPSITHALCQRRFQALTVARMVPKTVAPGVRRAVSTTVRIAASP